MSDQIFIPPEVYEPKAWWPERPTRIVIDEIRQYVQKFGTPHFWRGHTHSPPPADADIEYVGETSLPKSHSTRDRWAPCPCCSPTHPKFYKSVMIVWFRKEHVIRIMGPQCFRTINGIAHAKAMKRWNAEKKKESDIAYLLSRLDLVCDAANLLQSSIPTFEAIDKVRESVVTRLHHGRIKLWDQCRDGVLYTLEVPESGSEREAKPAAYGSIRGYRMINPDHRSFGRQIKTAIIAFRTIRYRGGNLKGYVDGLSNTDRRDTVNILTRTFRVVKKVYSEAADIRLFLSKETVATLANWARHKNCPIRFYISLAGDSLRMGRSPDEIFRVGVPRDFWGVLPELPAIADIEVAA